MTENGHTCESFIKAGNAASTCKNNNNWVKKKYCQKTCYAHGRGYDGDDCTGRTKSDKGALKCDAVTALSKVTTNTPKYCPDTLLSLNYWKPNGANGYGLCEAFYGSRESMKLSGKAPVYTYTGSPSALAKDLNKWASKQTGNPQADADEFLPGADGTFHGPHVITKASSGHPLKASSDIGMVLIKRVVKHPHTSKTQMVGSSSGIKQLPLMIADVFKVGYCIRCPSDVFENKWSTADCQGKDGFCKEKMDWANCLNSAINRDTNKIKDSYMCDPGSVDYDHFAAALSAF
jgi:hypothetical protein